MSYKATKGLSARWAAAPLVETIQSVQILLSPTRLPSVVIMGKTPQRVGGLRSAVDCNRLTMMMMMRYTYCLDMVMERVL